MKLVVFADHEIGTTLLTSMLARTDVTVVAAVTTEQNAAHWWPPLAPTAAAHSLPLLHYPSDAARIAQLDADYFLLLSWKHIMPPQMLQVPRRGTVNLHYSLLPQLRGVYPVNWALMEHAKETGVTYHLVDNRIDGGNIVLQQALAIRPNDTARSLQQRLDVLAASMIDGVADQLLAGAPGVPQQGPASYYSKEKFMATNELDLERTLTGREWIDLLRGKTFLPEGRNAYFMQDGKKYFVSVVIEPEHSA